MRWFLYRTLSRILELLPVKFMYILADIIGATAFKVWKRRREIGLKNLQIAYPESSKEERKRILKKNFQHVASSFLEIFKIPSLKNNWQEVFHLENKEVMEKAVSEGKGVILFLAHYGNWELFGALLRFLGYPLNVIAVKQKDEEFDRLITHYRNYYGIDIIGKGNALKEGIAKLKKGELLAFIGDQKVTSGGVWIPFFGKDALTTVFPAKLSKRKDIPIVVCENRRISPMRFYNNFEGPFYIEDRSIEEFTEFLNKKLEQHITKDPTQWFWAHRRWEK